MSKDVRDAEEAVEAEGAEPPEVAALRAVIDALAGVDPAALAGCATVRTMVQEFARLESVMCRQAEAFDRQGGWRATTAQTSSAWVATQTRSDRRVALRRRRLGRALRAMDLAADAFAAGTIGAEHVEVLHRARGRSRTVAQAYARDEAMLVGWATTEVFDRFRHRVDEWLQQADEGAAERQAERLHERRRLHLSQSIDDQWFLDALLDPVNGEIVHEMLDRIDRELFEADWATTRAALGREPVVADLPRTAAQRRADALVEMARRAGTMPAGGRIPVPLFTVLVGETTFAKVCELASGTIVAPGSLASWLDEAVIERIVFDGPERVIGVSHRRAFRGALRRAIEVRDRTCADHYCDCPAHRSQVDHVVPYSEGGVTALENGRLLCGFHNRRRSRRRRRPDEPA